MKVLFYDSLVGGHHTEYFENIILAGASIDKLQIVLVCPEVSTEKLAELAQKVRASVAVYPIEESQAEELIAEKNLLRKSRFDASMFCDAIEEHSPDLAVSLYFNLVFSGLATKMRNRDIECPIRGILFDPVPRLHRLASWKEKVSALPKIVRKRLQCLWFARAKCLDRVFVLNDESTAYSLNLCTQNATL